MSNRRLSFDPMFRTRQIGRLLMLQRPAEPEDVIAYMLTQHLQFRPAAALSDHVEPTAAVAAPPMSSGVRRAKNARELCWLAPLGRLMKGVDKRDDERATFVHC